MEKVLLLPPSRIQRIEVVNELYSHGDFFYGGIISIFTKENNLAGIDFEIKTLLHSLICHHGYLQDA